MFEKVPTEPCAIVKASLIETVGVERCKVYIVNSLNVQQRKFKCQQHAEHTPVSPVYVAIYTSAKSAKRRAKGLVMLGKIHRLKLFKCINGLPGRITTRVDPVKVLKIKKLKLCIKVSN